MPSGVGKVQALGCHPFQEVLLTALSCYQKVFAGQKWGSRGVGGRKDSCGLWEPLEKGQSGGLLGEKWPQAQSILWEEQGSQERPPWSGCLCHSTQAAAPGRGGGGCWSERPSVLLVLLLSQSKFFTERSWVPDGAGGDCGRLAAPGAHTIVGFPAPPT